MSSIDAVIQRARQPGGFSERRRFTVARQRAIQKMRKFALADPYYYVLELIQAAVANGAEYVDIDVARSSFLLSYVGGGFGEEGLAQLFDFLFASKESLELADLRQLALGVNALLRAEPREVVIESGDGTVRGTARISIDGRRNTVDVGTPDAPVRGTFLRASGLDRAKLGRGLAMRELSVIEERCLAASVPIIVNSSPVFGYTANRRPGLFGYRRTLTFDEGDLYGTIGIPDGPTDPHFRLMTWGVWVEAVTADLLPSAKFGGVVNFDRLHKTADHATIVRDVRFEELWARLKPYARQLLSGKTGPAAFDISTLGGRRLTTSSIRELARSSSVLVATKRPDGRIDEAWRAWADAFGEAIGGPVLVTGSDDTTVLRTVCGTDRRVIEVEIGNAEDLTFYRQPLATQPARPWLAGAARLPELSGREVAELLAETAVGHSLAAAPSVHSRDRIFDLRDRFVGLLGEAYALRAVVYSPRRSPGDGSLWVEVLTSTRTVWAGPVRSPFPGFFIQIEVGDVPPRVLRGEAGDGARGSIAELVARAVTQRATPVLQQVTGRVLETLEAGAELAGEAAGHIALSALPRSSIKRLRRDGPGAPSVRIELSEQSLPEAVLDVSVLRTHEGQGVSARGLEALMAACGGLVYGTVPEIPADLTGLDLSRVLALDLREERLLVALVGEGSYVRVDRRDVLAEHDGVLVRDIALGLREYGAFPLLVEGEDPSGWPEPRRTACEDALVAGLLTLFRSLAEDEHRRQAARHLLWYLVRKVETDPAAPLPHGLDRLPLLLDASGGAVSWADVADEVLSEQGIVMHDGWATDPAEIGALLGTLDYAGPRPYHPGDGLAMSPFAFHLLCRLRPPRPAFDHGLGRAKAATDVRTSPPVYVASAEVDEAGVTGTLGLPVEPIDEPAIAVVDRGRRLTGALHGPARETGVVGLLTVRGAQVDGPELERIARRASVEILSTLLERVPSLELGSKPWQRVVAALLRFAGLHVRRTAEPGGGIAVDVLDPLAVRILDLPLFTTAGGVAVSAWRILEEPSSRGAAGGRPSVELAPDLHPLLRRWLDAVLAPARVVRPAAAVGRVSLAPVPGAPSLDDVAVGRWLSQTLEQLRPDRDAGHLRVEVVLLSGNASGQTLGGAPPPPTRRDQPFALVFAGDRYWLGMRADHWLVERFKRDALHSPEAAVWLLLACYAHVNHMLWPVTNDHELELQERVVALLEAGKLGTAGSVVARP